MADRVTSFEARYPAKCPACTEQIHVGDPVTWQADMVVHVDCPEPVDEYAVTRAPCPSCFTVPAVNGECGCVG